MILGGSELGFLGRRLLVGMFGRELGRVRCSLLMIVGVSLDILSCNLIIIR